MGISTTGQLTFQKAMSSHLSIENVNKVSRMLSSNICENYFAILAKHMEGKRINMDEKDNWIVLQNFAAGLRSNVICCSNLHLELGACEKNVNEMKEKSSKIKDHVKNYAKQDTTIERRKICKQRRNHLMRKDEKILAIINEKN